MKLLYVCIGCSTNSSVATKVKGQVDGLIHNGVQANAVFILNGNEAINHNHISIKNVKINPNQLFIKLKLRRAYEEALFEVLKETEAEYIYLRYAFASRKIVKAIQNSGKKVIIERNCSIHNELIALWRTRKFQLKLGYVFSFIEDFLYPYCNELIYSNRVNMAACLVVCVDEEIEKYHKSKGGNTILLGNGINSKVIQPRTKYPLLKDERIKVLILDGTGQEAPWKGLDRLIKSIQYHNLEHRIEIWVAGKTSTANETSFVKPLGYLNFSEINQITEKVHAGSGNFKLYLKKLKDGTVLKNREYISRGLPILLAHKDFEIENSPLNKYCFRVPNSDEIIDLPAFLEWIEKFYSESPNHPSEMHKLAEEILDYKVKMKSLKEAIMEL